VEKATAKETEKQTQNYQSKTCAETESHTKAKYYKEAKYCTVEFKILCDI